MQQTNVDRALAALEEQHSDDPERAGVLRLTRKFKASWLELGEALSDAKRGKSWERWGYPTFEEYTKNELKLRADTVDKLTAGFLFLHKSAPQVLQRDPLDAPLPSYQAIDYLRRAEEAGEANESIPREMIADVRKKILDENAPLATVARLYNDTLFPVSDHDKRESSKKSLKSTATKLRDLLADSDTVPKRIVSSLGEALDELLTVLSEAAKAA